MVCCLHKENIFYHNIIARMIDFFKMVFVNMWGLGSLTYLRKAAMPPGNAAAGGECCGSNMGKCRRGRRKKHTKCAVPAGTTFHRKVSKFLPYFLYFTKSRKKKSPQGGERNREAAKDLILLVLNFGFVCWFEVCKTSNFPKGKRIYSFRLYEKNQKYPRGLRTSGLRGRFKSPLDT